MNELPVSTVDALLHKYFEIVAAFLEDSCALIYKKSISYLDLNRKANKLARYLQSSRVGLGDYVIVCMEPSTDFVIAMLAILKVGAAYIPLDPSSLPKERIRYIHTNSQAKLTITQQCYFELVDELKCDYFLVDRVKEEFEQLSGENLDLEIAEQSPAYVIYTSGSTGRPNGVVISHKAVCNHLCWRCKQFKLSEHDIFLQKSPVCFDASVAEFFTPLVCGAKLVIAPINSRKSAKEIVEVIQKYKITILHLIPNLFSEFIEHADQNNCCSLRLVSVGGDILYRNAANRFQEKFPEVKLYNLYGPTEATIDVTYYRYKTEKNLMVPIGRPIDNTEIVILDDNLNRVKTGEVGEIWLFGDCLANGYLNNPELTADRFLNLVPDSKLAYKTGDFVRFLPDGNIEFVGRKDSQVKIKGYRIDLSDIKVAMDKIVDRTNSVVLVKNNDNTNTKYIAVFLLANNNHSYNIERIRFDLSQLLPEYMLPTRYYVVSKFPLLLSGKIDRRKLANYEVELVMDHSKILQPKNSKEKAIVEIWSLVLDLPVDQIGTDANFFSLGGDSLQINQMLLMLNIGFGVELDTAVFYGSPTVHTLAKCIKQAVNDHSEQERAISRAKSCKLSSGQELIIAHQYTTNSCCLYNEPLSLTIEERVKVPVLEKAINELFRRHEMLRIRIDKINGEFSQRIVSYRPRTLHYVDLSAEVASYETVMSMGRRFLKKNLNLAHESPIRFQLVKIAEQYFKLFIVIHHVVSDGITAFKILLPELKELYCTDRLPVVSATNYFDYVNAQCDYLSSKQAKIDEDYWRNKFSNYSWDTSYFVDSHSMRKETSGRVKYFNIEYDTYKNIVLASRKNKVSLFCFLLTVFNILVYKISMNNDVVVATAVDTRTRGFADVTGNFLNMLLLRNNIAGHLVFSELLDQVSSDLIESLSHKMLPIQNVLQALELVNKRKMVAPFELAFIFEPGNGNLGLKWSATQTEIHTDTAKFPLTFEVTEESTGLAVRAEYQAALISDELVSRLIETYGILLQQTAQNQTKTVASFNCLSEENLNLLMNVWNGKGIDFHVETVLALFAEQVASVPNKIATEFGGRTLSYKEFDELTNVFANYIASCDLPNEAVIPVYMDRSIELLVSVIAILKAGYAFTIIDSTLPEARVRHILHDSNAKLICSSRQFMPRLNYSGIDVLLIDDYEQYTTDTDCIKSLPDIDGNKLAYVVYTSGSTGKPKGVMIEHGALSNTIINQIDSFKITQKSKVLSLSYVGFDAFISELFISLCGGATFYFMNYHHFPTPEMISAVVKSYKPTFLALTPVMLSLLKANDLPGLETLVTMGEKCPDYLVKRWAPRLQFINAYGPSEVAICASLELFEANACTSNIGQPLANVKVYVLDKDMQLVPPGVIGELYIGGAGLARGYLNNSILSVDSFVPNKFSSASNDCLYRTGDLVKWLATGKLQYVGRLDEQVKIRGCRVELAEVENCLASYQEIKQAAVTVVEKKGSAVLHAYLVANMDDTLELEAIRKHCSLKLPDYMVPAKFFKISGMPLLSNGKIDKSRLSVGEQLKPQSLTSIVPEILNSIQKKLAVIWAGVLGIAEPNPNDDFFDLGGDSLRVIELISKVSDTFGVKLEPHLFCSVSTIERLSKFIGQR